MLRACKFFLMNAAAVLLMVDSAGAVPLGSGTVAMDLQGNATDNVTCIIATYDNATYDVFGTNVNLTTDVGGFFCTGGSVAGVLQPSHCVSYPDGSILVADITGSSICLDPPTCAHSSFVTDTFSFTGSLATTIGSDVVYTSDGTFNYAGSLGSTSIPGCALAGGVLHFTGNTGLNAFQTQATTTGTNQAVTFPETTFYNPLTNTQTPVDVAITFSQVSGGGTTTVTATSNAAGTIPANFAFAADGFQAAFLDIRTTATIVPPIEVCSSYDDIDNDGYVDGTSPPVPESALSFTHGENGTFVDRTSSRDPDANTICATVDHLSPFAVMVRTTGLCAAENDPCDDGDACTVTDVCDASLKCVGTGTPNCDDSNACTADSCVSPSGCSHTPIVAASCNTTNGKGALQVKNSDDDSKDQLKFQWQNGNIALGDFGTPTGSNSYQLCVFDQNKVLASALAPAGSTCGGGPCWATSDKGVKYSDKTKPPVYDGVAQISGSASTDGKAKLQLKLGGLSMRPIDIASIAYPVRVQLTTSDGQCWEQEFGSADEKKNDGSQIKLAHAAP